MRDASDPGCPPVYHSPDEPLDDVLCRIMWVALRCYDEMATYLYGNEDLADYQVWTDYDRVTSFDVVRITPDNAAWQGYRPTQCGLKVRYDSYWVADVDSLAAARLIISVASATEVALEPDDEPRLPRWIPGPAGGIGRRRPARVAG